MDLWYLGTSTEHYQSCIVLMDKTKAEQITDTIIFHHRQITNPIVSAADAIVTAAADLTATIKYNMQKDLETM
jgi:hypothetical protein